MSALVANLAIAAGILATGLAILLMVIGLLSYVRVRHGRFLWVTIAFAAFAAQGLLVTLRIYATRGDLPDALPGLALLNLGIIVALYLAVLRR